MDYKSVFYILEHFQNELPTWRSCICRENIDGICHNMTMWQLHKSHVTRIIWHHDEDTIFCKMKNFLKKFQKCCKSRFPTKTRKINFSDLENRKFLNSQIRQQIRNFEKISVLWRKPRTRDHRRVTLFRDKMEFVKGFLRDEFLWRWTNSNKQEYSKGF